MVIHDHHLINWNRMMVPIPEAVGDFVDRQVASGAYKDAVAYIRALVEADRKRQAREHLEMLLVKGRRIRQRDRNDLPRLGPHSARRDRAHRESQTKTCGVRTARGKTRHR